MLECSNQLLATVLTGLFLLFLLYYKNIFRRNLPPGPLGLPILGVLPFIRNSPGKQFSKWSKKYGSVISARMGTKLWVILNDYDSVYQCLVKQSSKFCGRPSVQLYDNITKGHGLILIDGNDLWRVQRKFGISTFRQLGMGARSTETRIVEEAFYLNESIRNHNGKPFDIASDLSNAVANVVCGLVIGRRFEYEDPVFEDINTKVQKAFTDPDCNSAFIDLMLAPALGYLPSFARYSRKLVNNVEACIELLHEIIKEHKASYDKHNIRDFVDAFISEQKREADSTFTELQLIHYVRDIFVAGVETTTSTLRWSLLCLIHFPEAQERMRNEILQVIGNNKRVNMEDASNMPYTCSFIQEVYRFRTVVPLSVAHKATCDVEINGFLIPKDTTVIPHLDGVHKDPNLWTEPDEFIPERHLDENGKFVPSGQIIPFSLGARGCLGERMARMEVFIFLASLVQHFEVLNDPNKQELPNIDGGVSGLTFQAYNFTMVAKQL